MVLEVRGLEGCRPMRRVLSMVMVAGFTFGACGGDSSSDSERLPTDPRREVTSAFIERVAPRGDSYEEALARSVTDIEEFWSQRYPVLFGVAYREVADHRPIGTGEEIRCEGVDRAYRDLKGRVLYCASEDTVIFDELNLLRDLHEFFGDLAVGAVLARAWGSVIQARAGFHESTLSKTVLDIAADCFAGAWMGQAVDGASLEREWGDVELALAGYVLTDGAHASNDGGAVMAFDRVEAVRDGIEGGAERCVAYADARTPPQVTDLTSDADGVPSHDAALTDIVADLDAYWVVRIPGFEPISRARGVDATAVSMCAGEEPSETARDPIAYCSSTSTIRYDEEFFVASDAVVGPGSAVAYLSDAWAMAAVIALGHSMDVATNSLVTDCLSGTWAGDVAAGIRRDAEIAISSPMLDRMISSIFVTQRVRDSLAGGFERASAFRAGFLATSQETSSPVDVCRRFL
jgi:predicted metalloprotease